MSKTAEMSAAVDELRNAAAVISAVADQLEELFSTNSGPAPRQEVKPVIKLEDVRAVLATASRNGHTAEVRGLLGKYGADKLSMINPADYEALLKEAEVFANAT